MDHYKELSDAECNQFRSQIGNFNDMLWACHRAGYQSWSKGVSADRMTQRKAHELMALDYKLDGHTLVSRDETRVAIVRNGAVRWLSAGSMDLLMYREGSHVVVAGQPDQKPPGDML